MQSLGNYKVIKTGKIVEIFHSEYGFKQNDDTNQDVEPGQLLLRLYPEEKRVIDRNLEYKLRSAFRAQNKIRRLVQSNFTKNSKFITLTFRDTNKLNINNPEETQVVFKEFIDKLFYKFGNFRYLYVIEFQKRGAVHYHMVADIGYIDNKILSDIWGWGFIRINRIERSSKVGVYISKYLTKEAYSERNFKYRKFGYSKSLIKPTVFYGVYAERLLHHFLNSKITPSYSGIYDSLYNGRIKFYEFTFYNENEGGGDT